MPPPEDDMNVHAEVEVVSEELPPPVPVLIQQGCTSWEFSATQVAGVEHLTKGQGSNSEWFKQKVGRITASNMHSVLTKVRNIERSAPKRLDCSSLLEKLCSGSVKDISHLPAIKYGQSMEAEARKSYMQKNKSAHQHLSVQECGLFIVKQHAYMSASPDALVDCSCCGQGLLEIKCPLTLAHVDPSKEPPSYIVTVDGRYTLKKEHPYYNQVISQMGATGRKWCDFFVYSRHESLNVVRTLL